jgi:hypothetical protein
MGEVPSRLGGGGGGINRCLAGPDPKRDLANREVPADSPLMQAFALTRGAKSQRTVPIGTLSFSRSEDDFPNWGSSPIATKPPLGLPPHSIPSALSESRSPCPPCALPTALSRSRSGRSRREAKPNASKTFHVVT